MLSRILPKHQYISIICLLIGVSILQVQVNGLHLTYSDSSEEKTALSHDKFNGLRDRKEKFVCPSSFGAYPDIEDCQAFYTCAFGRASRRKCARLMRFDKYRRVCLHFLIAVCDDGKEEKTTKGSTDEDGKTTFKDGTTTVKESKFACPSVFGDFPDPNDCSKFYTCVFFIPTSKTCPKSQLFDGVKKECKPENEVHCGTRQRPTSENTIATTPMLPATTPAELTTRPEPITTEEPITHEEPKTPKEPQTSEGPTTDSTTTGPPKPTGPPETDCDEDDLDCIIDKTGEIPDWFECPVDIGSYRHPSSKKLFIFCLNWKPYVKKCGQDLIYSEEVNTCVSP